MNNDLLTFPQTAETIGGMKTLRPFVVLLALVMASCATTSREAEPLNIQELTPAKSAPAPLVIQRVKLNQVLSRGPGRFFQRMPILPYKKAGRFVGFQIVALYGQAAPHPNGLHVGDVVTAVIGKAVTTPDQFMKVWQTMRKAQTLSIELVRNDRPLRIDYPIVE
jgi:type II secretory pathway component PulC